MQRYFGMKPASLAGIGAAKVLGLMAGKIRHVTGVVDQRDWKKKGRVEQGMTRPLTEENSLNAFAYGFDGFLEHIHGNIGFFFGNDEWRRDANSARAAAQEEDAVFKNLLDDAVAQLRTVFFGFLIFDDFDADHQAAAADVPDQFVLARPAGHAFQHVCTDFGGVME